MKDDIFWFVLKLEINNYRVYNMHLEGFWFLLEDYFF